MLETQRIREIERERERARNVKNISVTESCYEFAIHLTILMMSWQISSFITYGRNSMLFLVIIKWIFFCFQLTVYGKCAV